VTPPVTSLALTGGNVIQDFDVDSIQHALDCLIIGDRLAAAERFSHDVVLIGTGGCIGGFAVGLAEVLDRFKAISRATSGSFGTEVETVFKGNAAEVVVLTRHWASIAGEQFHATQALLVTADGGRIRTINALSRPGPASGIWD
jgi:ketosteroid isomerase-like protein